VEKYNSLEGKEVTFKPIRPFRAPHYSATKAAIFGGGCNSQKIIQLLKSYSNFSSNNPTTFSYYFLKGKKCC